MTSWIQIIFLLLIVVLLISLIKIQRMLKSKESTLTNRLQKSQKYLQSHVSKLDSLVASILRLREYTVKTEKEKIDQGDFFRAVLDYACRLLNTEMGSVMLLDSQKQELRIVAAKGISPDVIESTHLNIGEGIAGRVAQTGIPIYVDDIESDERFKRSNNERYGSRSFISIPMRSPQKIIGVMNLNHKEPGFHFEEHDVKIVMILSEQAASTWENIEMFQNFQRYSVELLQAISQALDKKDSYSNEHAPLARQRARGILNILNVPEEIGQYVEYAALMHDIGKIGVDDSILQKPGKLTPDEFSKIKEHPEIGARMMALVSYLAPVVPMVRYHQEWFNGQGYPEGLAGEEIPLGARIVAVLDVWDALTTNRPYRKALPRTRAIQELKKARGLQFDPKVVDAFLGYLKREEPDESSRPSSDAS